MDSQSHTGSISEVTISSRQNSSIGLGRQPSNSTIPSASHLEYIKSSESPQYCCTGNKTWDSERGLKSMGTLIITTTTALPSKQSSISTTLKEEANDQISSCHTQPSVSKTIKSSIYLNPSDKSIENKPGTFSAINIIIGKMVGVGIYSIPSSVFNSVGSVGASILLWIVGSLISFCGLAVYLDLGTGIPVSGGERVYLERIYRKPYKLASCVLMAYVVLLGISTPNCIVLGEYTMYAFEIAPSHWNVRCVAAAAITLLCLFHIRFPKLGLRMINCLSIGTMTIIVVVILSGIAGAFMHVGASKSSSPDEALSTAQKNFSNIFIGSSVQPYDYATALLKVLYCYRGYSTANQVISDFRDPVKTLRVAAPIALGLVSIGYLFVIIAYFLVVSSDDFRTSGIVIAGHFFRNIFGPVVGENILPLFIMISAFCNISATSYAQARINQELGRDGLLPFSGWLGKRGAWETATAGFFIHWLISILVIILPAPGQFYNFLVELSGYPVSLISVAISLGLLYLHYNSQEDWHSHFHARAPLILVYAISNLLLLIMPWVKPRLHRADSQFPYYAYPATALAIMGSGVIYWCFLIRHKPLLRKEKEHR